MLHLDARTCGDDTRDEHRAEAQRLDTHARPQTSILYGVGSRGTRAHEGRVSSTRAGAAVPPPLLDGGTQHSTA
eukprot:2763922-Prymnesium_polylepis.1